MYKGTRSGQSYGVSGKYYSWSKDQEIDVEKGELDGAYGIMWVEEKPTTKKEIKKALDEKGIEYDGRKSKESLLELLNG